MLKLQRFEEVNSYYSRTFSIVTESEREGYSISVYDEVSKTLIESYSKLEKNVLETMYEWLKAKYIFDYQKALVANQ